MNVVIRRPKVEDVDSINKFFKLVIWHTFKRNGIGDLVETIEAEIEYKKKILSDDVESNGEKRYFLIAVIDNMIVGTIEHGPSDDLVNSCTNGKLNDIEEIGTVFVHPKYQGKGIGSIMLTHIFQELRNKGIDEFCFDSGYKSAQKIWTKKFGAPEYHLKDYWGEGADHMIWRLTISDVIK